MNTYKKYAANVFIAVCEEEYENGDIITVTTKYGKENNHIVHNFIGYMGTKDNPKYCYSITREDGLTFQDRAIKKAEKIAGYKANAEARSNAWFEKSNEGRGFLSLAEPIKIGHHSEGRHRALIERNNSRMRNCISESDKAKSYESRIEYWESKADEINLSMPESLDFYSIQLEEATEYHQSMKKGDIPRTHSYSLTYAKKRVNDLTRKVELAKKLWG